MAKSNVKLLSPFLKAVTPFQRVAALWIRDFVWDLYPQSNELIYDNYNALAVGWSPTDRVGHIFCSFALGRTSGNVHFGFYWGSKIADPKKLLIGQGNQYRYLLVPDVNKFPKAYIKQLVKEAYAYSCSLVKDPKQLMSGKTIVKSISDKKRTKGTKPKVKATTSSRKNPSRKSPPKQKG